MRGNALSATKYFGEYYNHVDYEFSDGRLYLRRTPEEREPLLQRLRRIEGQVRGLHQMLERDRYCGDELQQINAVIAATREVALLIAGQHIAAGVEYAAQTSEPQAVLEEVQSILRTAIKLG